MSVAAPEAPPRPMPQYRPPPLRAPTPGANPLAFILMVFGAIEQSIQQSGTGESGLLEWLKNWGHSKYERRRNRRAKNCCAVVAEATLEFLKDGKRIRDALEKKALVGDDDVKRKERVRMSNAN